MNRHRHNKSEENNKTEWREKKCFGVLARLKQQGELRKGNEFQLEFLAVCRLLISVYIWVSLACSDFMKAQKNYTQLVYIVSERKFQLFSFCREFDCAINSLRTTWSRCATEYVKWKRLAGAVGSRLLFSTSSRRKLPVNSPTIWGSVIAENEFDHHRSIPSSKKQITWQISGEIKMISSLLFLIIKQKSCCFAQMKNQNNHAILCDIWKIYYHIQKAFFAWFER